MKKSGWESLVTFLWLKAFFSLFYSRLKQSSVGHQTACFKWQSVFEKRMHARHGPEARGWESYSRKIEGLLSQ